MLEKRLFLRFHMSLILTGTALVGLLASKILLIAHVDNIVIRYPVAVIVSYLCFFGFMKLWLSYVTSSGVRKSHDVEDALDAASSISDLSTECLPTGGTYPGGGGGSSGGGGASGSFDSVASHADVGAHDVLVDTAANASHGVGGAVGEGAGEAASGLAEEGGLILVVLGLALAIVFGTGLYLLYDAPFILSEVAFDFILAASLIKSTRKIDDPDWKGSVFRTTWKPFAIALLISLFGAFVLHSNYPEAHKLSEILKR